MFEQRLQALIHEVEQLQREAAALADYLRREPRPAAPGAASEDNDWRYRVFTAHEFVYVRMRGCLTLDTFMALRGTASTDARFNPTYRSILDLRGCDPGEMTSDDVRMLAERSLFRPQAKRALVADTPELYGITRLYEIRHTAASVPTTIHVVTTLDDALAWLGLEALSRELEP